MTQHPFDREFSEQEIAELNAIDRQADSQELTEEETKQIFGGGCDHFISGIKKIDPPKGVTTMALGEEGGDPYP